MNSVHLLLLTLVSVPLAAQIDPSGEWAPQFHEDFLERIPGPEIGDYLGLPITDAARMRGDTWDASLLTLPEHQCKPHPSDYGSRGPANLRIWKEVDTATQTLIAYHTHISWQAPERTIYMDGRPHPPDYAAHTWQGFSTGTWEGDTLTVTTTHLKIGWIRRNGIPRSDRAVLTEHWIRHGDYLTLVSIVNDPVYLTEPFIRTTNWIADPRQVIPPYPCESVVEVPRPRGSVPNHLPGTNTFLAEFPARYGLPPEAARGGAETMYPEYRSKTREAVAAKAEPAPAAAARPNSMDGEIHVLPVQGDIYMLVGAGGNITLQAGKDGVLLVDTGLAQMSDKVIAAIRQISDKPIRYIVNTHVHADHIGGNESIAKLGSTIAGGNVTGDIGDADKGAAVIAHLNVLTRMSGTTPSGAWPTDTFTDEKHIFFNGEGIEIMHRPAAHTDGDSVVYFRRSDVVSAGDIFTPGNYPVIDLQEGGNIQGIIDELNHLIELTIPAEKQEGGTYVIPGHGRLCDQADVVEYRDMATIIRDRIQSMVNKGMSLDQVKAAKPTRDYDPLYGAGDMFVESVYKSLKK
jgi:cyclase